MRAKYATRRVPQVLVALVLILSVTLLFVPYTSASGSCKFCSYSPFSHSLTNSAVGSAIHCGTNTNHFGPATTSGTNALIYPESTACTDPTTFSTYDQQSTAGFNQISTSALGGPVTAVFYWNLTWSASYTLPCTAPTATGTVTLQIISHIKDTTTGLSAGSQTMTIFVITSTTCNTSSSNIQNTPTSRTPTIAFTATSGDTYVFDSEVYGETFASCNYCGPAGSTVDAKLNMAPTGYGATMSALQVY